MAAISESIPKRSATRVPVHVLLREREREVQDSCPSNEGTDAEASGINIEPSGKEVAEIPSPAAIQTACHESPTNYGQWGAKMKRSTIHFVTSQIGKPTRPGCSETSQQTKRGACRLMFWRWLSKKRRFLQISPGCSCRCISKPWPSWLDCCSCCWGCAGAAMHPRPTLGHRASSSAGFKAIPR